MSVAAIGASVKRTEDIRFITGKGHYVDDVNRPGQAYAYFLRSPHAHATIDKIDMSAALKAPGVVAIFTGDDIAADKVGGLICGVTIHSKDGSPMRPAPIRRSPRARCATSATMSLSSSPRPLHRRATRPRKSRFTHRTAGSDSISGRPRIPANRRSMASRRTIPSTTGTSVTKPRPTQPLPPRGT